MSPPGGARRPRRAENAQSASQSGEDAGLHLPPGAGSSPADGATGLPGLRTWPRVYLAVGAIFVLWIGLLTWLTEAYS